MNHRLTALLAGISATVFGTAALAAGDPANAEALRLSAKELASVCTYLDKPEKRARMDALQLKLLVMCGRSSELGQVESVEMELADADRIPGTDSIVNDPTGEAGETQTQNETSIARSDVTGTLCSGFNDSYSGVVQGLGYTGFARSTDDGVTFTDGGGFGSSSFGDPSMIWNRSDGNFYIATLHSSGLGYWRSTDDCQTFQFVGLAHAGGADDKELLSIDNNPASPFYGRVYMVWTDFNDARIYSTHTDDGTSWSTPVPISASGADVQGAWPIVGPDGTIYVGWIRWNPYFSGPTDFEVVRSTNGGVSYTQVTNPATGVTNPYTSGPTSICGRPALDGNIRYLPSPQLAVSPNNDLHIVYSYDPDGRNVGDAIDVFYRRSSDQGATWTPEYRVHDDATQNDQFFPTLSAGPTGRIVVAWYDRRLDPNNLAVDYYAATSDDGGTTWGPNERISDVSSPIYIDPNLASCYHGDYDQQLQTASSAFLQWADDRAVRSGHADPDTYVDQNVFEPDFFIGSGQASAAVCAPDEASYTIDIGQALGFSDPVTMSVSGNPAGTSTAFSVNPVVPAGSTTLTVGGTGGATAGTYAMDVTGTAGAKQRTAQLSLALFTAVPDQTALVSPVDGATDQLTSPTLTWSDATQAGSYLVEIASDAAFSNIVDSASVEATSYTVATGLAPDSEYYWRVTANNICGVGTTSAVSQFGTQNIICTFPNLSIPDDSAAGTDSAQGVASAGILTDLNVSIVATHTYVGDLIFTLTHNDSGTSAVLIDRPGRVDAGFGCSNNNIDATLDDEAATPVEDECSGAGIAINGTFTPNNPLAVFDGESLGGTWTLNVSDNAGADLGTFDEWCLLPALEVVATDTDGDGVNDDTDNCTVVANGNQRDTDGDGHGNVCDADLNNDCVVNPIDLGLFKAVFFTGDADSDLNGDGVVNPVDLGIFKSLFFLPPGPSAAGQCTP